MSDRGDRVYKRFSSLLLECYEIGRLVYQVKFNEEMPKFNYEIIPRSMCSFFCDLHVNGVGKIAVLQMNGNFKGYINSFLFGAIGTQCLDKHVTPILPYQLAYITYLRLNFSGFVMPMLRDTHWDLFCHSNISLDDCELEIESTAIYPNNNDTTKWYKHSFTILMCHRNPIVTYRLHGILCSSPYATPQVYCTSTAEVCNVDELRQFVNKCVSLPSYIKL